MKTHRYREKYFQQFENCSHQLNFTVVFCVKDGKDEKRLTMSVFVNSLCGVNL